MTDNGRSDPIRWLNEVIEKARLTGRFEALPPPATRRFIHFNAGLPNVAYTVARKPQTDTVKVGLYFESRDRDTNNSMFERLWQDREAIEQAIPLRLLVAKSDLQRRFIEIERPAILDASDPDSLSEWTVNTLLRFKELFDPRIRHLRP